jgi:hypothetical protein
MPVGKMAGWFEKVQVQAYYGPGIVGCLVLVDLDLDLDLKKHWQ